MMKKIVRFLTILLSLNCFAVLTLSQASATEQVTDPNKVPATNQTKVVVYVDTYAPYINKETSPLGSAAKTLKVLGEYAGIDFEFRYVPFADAIKLMESGKNAVSFPYYFTEERDEVFYYSAPIVNISIQLFFNRQYSDLTNIDNIKNLKIGKVDGYSYGENIDKLLGNAQVFDSHMTAMTALMENEINVLPMANGVMDTLLNTHFADQRQLIRPIKNMSGSEQFHVLAPRTPFGKSIRYKLDKAIKLKFGDKTPQDNRTDKAPDADVAELIPAEGFPAIIGEDLNNAEVNYTLPIGTKVVVLDWSESIRSPNTTTGINRNMLLTSKVVILNGPHVGKELMVRNMHIKLN
jgi:polar amino acid transport system substrate-binding protein